VRHCETPPARLRAPRSRRSRSHRKDKKPTRSGSVSFALRMASRKDAAGDYAVGVGLRPDDPLAQSVVQAIRHGSPEEVKALLDAHPTLARERLVGGSDAQWNGRTLLHTATDWPGHVPGAGAKIAALAAAGADAAPPLSGAPAAT